MIGAAVAGPRELVATLRFILQHPIASRDRAAALSRWMKWQVGSRIAPGAIVVPFVGDTKLVVEPGMTGATGNIYTGLHEFEEMSFLLHMVRDEEDLFVDVGANVGSFTMLAAGVRGAQVIALEPSPPTFAALERNVAVNGVGSRVRAVNAALGAESGSVRFTSGLDTVNHVAAAGEGEGAAGVDVEVTTLDEVVGGEEPVLLKIDVEGYETRVIDGAARTLARPSLLAVVMELNGSGAKYGFDEPALHARMLALGFESVSYDPFERRVSAGAQRGAGNYVYARDLAAVRARVSAAAPVEVLGVSI